jgi:hypothetical protein
LKKGENTTKFEVKYACSMEKDRKASKIKKQKTLKPKTKVTKTGGSCLRFRMIQFFLNGSNLIRDRNLICFGRIPDDPVSETIQSGFCSLEQGLSAPVQFV